VGPENREFVSEQWCSLRSDCLEWFSGIRRQTYEKASEIMSSDTPSNPPQPNMPAANPPPSTSPSSARDRFQELAKSRVESSEESTVERKLWEGGYSIKAMYGTWIGSAILTVLVIIAALYSGVSTTVWMIVGAAIVVWWCIALAVYLYRKLGVHYELTTQRFIHQCGILVRKSDRIEVIDIEDVAYTQGIIQRMLGVGTITVTSRDRSHPELVIRGIDNVPEIASLVDDVRREERRHRMLHMEAS
jgi:uncharacterized membrane protein YdbT with pleckstrin-like domain